jgi:hypothetical protein
MTRRDVTLADKISLSEKIKNQAPNSSHRQLAKITGVPKSAITSVSQQQEKLRDRELPKNGSVKIRIQMLKRSAISCCLS